MEPSEEQGLWDEEGFWRHCQVAEVLFRAMGTDPHTNHHIRSAIREASYKVGNVRDKDRKRRAQYMSEAAEAQILNGDCTDLVVDHLVPVSEITKMVYQLTERSRSQIGAVIRQWSTFAVVTRGEHERLRREKLYHTMPKDWDRENRFARYDRVRIRLKQNRYPELRG